MTSARGSLPIVAPDATAAPAERAPPGKHERALDDAWRAARARMWTRPHLARSLALWRRFHLTPLDLGAVKLKVPVGQVPDCENCEELCCTGPNARVSLRLRDVARLLDHGHRAHIVTEPTIAVDKRAPWARREADQSVYHRVFPVLARDGTGTCTFLTEDRLCGAWPDWPLSCARYPYALDLQLKVIFYAKGCASTQTLSADEAPPRVRALARAVIDAYNERIKDVVTLALAPTELADAGLLEPLATAYWPWRDELERLSVRARGT